MKSNEACIILVATNGSWKRCVAELQTGVRFLCRLINDCLITETTYVTWWIGKDSEGSDHGLIEVLSRNFPGGCEENHEEPHLR
jgi:hypothetical protein